MVDALVEATALTIAERGLTDTTTNQVAARAGVSVGSLYQYFSNKEALLDAVMARFEAELISAIGTAMDAHLDDDLHTLLESALTAVFDVFESRRGLNLELARGWYHERTMQSAHAVETFLKEKLHLYLLRHHGAWKFQNLPAVLYVAFNSAIFTGIRYFSDPPAYLNRQDVIEQITAMIVGYLTQAGQPAAQKKPPRKASSR